MSDDCAILFNSALVVVKPATHDQSRWADATDRRNRSCASGLTVTRWLQLRFDFDSTANRLPIDFHSTP